MAGIARGRLQEERKLWRKDHPHGFVAKPRQLPDGTQDILHWDCVVPGKAGTIWELGRYPVYMCAHCQLFPVGWKRMSVTGLASAYAKVHAARNSGRVWTRSVHAW